MPYQLNVIVISRPAEIKNYARRVTLLCDSQESPGLRQTEALFVENGFRVDLSTLDQVPPMSQDVISLLDLAAPFFDNISAERLAAFQRYVGHLSSSGILWATRSCQVGCKDPRYGQVLGAARTARSELLIDFATLEIDTVDDKAVEALFQVFMKFQRRERGPVFDPDWEFALIDGTINIPRYRWISVPERLSEVSKEELPRKVRSTSIPEVGPG